jgi:hypothetical protein
MRMQMDGGGACGGGSGGIDDKTKKNKIIITIMICGELKTFPLGFGKQSPAAGS